MILKVEPEELLEFSNVIEKDAEVYKKEIDNMMNSLEKLKSVWQGDDATAFTTNFSYFLERMKGIPETLDVLAKASKKSSEGFTERDDAFAKELKEGALNNE